MFELEHLSVSELKQGYTFDAAGGVYRCLVCGQQYETGEVSSVGGRWFEAPRAIEEHMAAEHGGYLGDLIDSDSKYSPLTDNQRQLLKAFASGATDKDIASAMGVSISTVRHQKFMFREKAKQAKMMLAIYEGVFESREKGGQAMMPIHDKAKMVDERYVVTEEERAHILATSFTSLDPLKLKSFSPKEKKKVVILAQIAAVFERGRAYSEREVNALLKDIFEDFATLRRYLIQYGFMERTKDGAKYWLT